MTSGDAEHEDEMIARAGQGDAGAIGLLVTRNLPRIMSLARRMLADVAEAEGVYVAWTVPAAGGVLTEMVLALYTLTDFWTWSAAAKAPLPGSLKLTLHVPEPEKSTQPSLSAQPVEYLSKVMTTLSPDVAFAPGAYEPPALPASGNVLVVMEFSAYTVMLWETWVAAA